MTAKKKKTYFYKCTCDARFENWEKTREHQEKCRAHLDRINKVDLSKRKTLDRSKRFNSAVTK